MSWSTGSEEEECGNLVGNFVAMAVGRAAKHLLRNGSKQLALRSGGGPSVLRPARGKTEKKREPAYPVKVPQSREYFDTPNLKVAVGMVAAIVLAKLTMMVCMLYTLPSSRFCYGGIALHCNIADPGVVVLTNWGFFLC